MATLLAYSLQRNNDMVDGKLFSVLRKKMTHSEIPDV